MGKERANLDTVVGGIDRLTNGLTDAHELLEMAEAEDDESSANDVTAEVDSLEQEVEKLEFQRMFSGELDRNNAFLDIQSGAGGTEAQDWSEIDRKSVV